MDIFDKAGKVVGDAVAKARERERQRISDRVMLLDRIAQSARQLVKYRGQRPGLTWDMHGVDEALKLVADAEALDDEPLTAQSTRSSRSRASTAAPRRCVN